MMKFNDIYEEYIEEEEIVIDDIDNEIHNILDVEEEDEIDESVSKTASDLKRKKKEALKNKKELIKKIGIGEYKKRILKAKKDRKRNKIKLAKARLKYSKSSKGKRAAKLAKKRRDKK